MHTIMKLQYDYDALEPHIDAKTMEIHYSKHYQGYVDKLNKALESYPELQKKPIIHLISDLDSVPNEIREGVRNNGGGAANHSLFFMLIGPKGGGVPTGELGMAIQNRFGKFEEFKKKFKEAATSRFGSGWAWLCLDTHGELQIESTPNQDSPWMEGRSPIFGLDVWEHAYYLKYQNRRGDYIDSFWNVVQWELVENNFEATLENRVTA